MATEEVIPTRDRIQAAALELFIAQGFEKTSLREIADRLGFTKAALYYHFPSKADLIRSVLQPMMDDVDRLLERMEAGDHPPRTVLEAYFDVMSAHRTVFAALVRDASAFAYVDLETWIVNLVDRFENLLVGPDAPPERRVHALVAIGGLGRSVVLPFGMPAEKFRTAAVDAAYRALDPD